MDITTLSEDQQAYYALKKFMNYKEEPVDILTFLKDPYFLGNIFNPGGQFLVFDKWVETLLQIFPNNVISHRNVLFSGGIGLGKTSMMIVCQLYSLHKFLCIDEFPRVARLAHIKPYAFTFATTRLESAIDFLSDIKSYMEFSPYFQETRQKMGKKEWDRWVKFKPASIVKHLLSNDNLSIILSEINELTGKGKDGRTVAWALMTEAHNRLNSRFMRLNGLLPQLLIDSSSKSVNDMTSQFVAEAPFRKDLLAFKYAKWDMVKDAFFNPRKTDGRTKFYVFMGNTEVPPQVLDVEELDDDSIPINIDKDLCRVAPIEYLEDFEASLEESIRAIMGVPISIGDSFFSPKNISSSFSRPSLMDEVLILDEDDPTIRIEDNVGLQNSLDEIPPFVNIYIGIDIGIKKDLTGISIAYIDKWDEKEINGDYIMRPHFQVLTFGLGRKLKGQSTSIHRLFNFLIYLSTRFVIGMIHFDTFGSIQIMQDLIFKQIPCETLSVESESPYSVLKNLFSNGQITVNDNSLLKAELISLIRDPKKPGNLNHPQSGEAEIDSKGKYLKAVSKDLADATCRAVLAAYTYSRDNTTGSPISNMNDTIDLMENLYSDLDRGYQIENYIREFGGLVTYDRKRQNNPFYFY